MPWNLANVSPKAVIAGIGTLVFVLMGAALMIQTSRLETVTLERNEARRVARENAEAVEALRAHVANAQRALRLEREAYARRIKALEATRMEVERAEDGPVAPALRRALDGLREP